MLGRVAASGGSFQRPLRLILAFHIHEVRVVQAVLHQQLLPVHNQRKPGLTAVQQPYDLGKS